MGMKKISKTRIQFIVVWLGIGTILCANQEVIHCRTSINWIYCLSSGHFSIKLSWSSISLCANAFLRVKPWSGRLVYALCIPGLIISIIILLGGKSWSFWSGGILLLIFSIYGYYVDYIKKEEWRKPIKKSIFFPYVFWYLATIMLEVATGFDQQTLVVCLCSIVCDSNILKY